MATFNDLLKVRDTVNNLPQGAKNLIGGLWCDVANGTDDYFEEEVEKIASNFKCSVEDLMTYYSYYELDRQENVVVFYKDDKSHTYDTRFGTQYLPKGVIVIAIVTPEGATFVNHYQRDEQVTEDLKKNLQEALLALFSFWWVI
jgi:hypothetical protein